MAILTPKSKAEGVPKLAIMFLPACPQIHQQQLRTLVGGLDPEERYCQLFKREFTSAILKHSEFTKVVEIDSDTSSVFYRQVQLKNRKHSRVPVLRSGIPELFESGFHYCMIVSGFLVQLKGEIRDNSPYTGTTTSDGYHRIVPNLNFNGPISNKSNKVSIVFHYSICTTDSGYIVQAGKIQDTDSAVRMGWNDVVLLMEGAFKSVFLAPSPFIYQ